MTEKPMPTSKEFRNFAALTDRLLTVPRHVIKERIDRHREMAASNPRKRGPKPKAIGASGSGREDA
jgi:hypothetical protein